MQLAGAELVVMERWVLMSVTDRSVVDRKLGWLTVCYSNTLVWVVKAYCVTVINQASQPVSQWLHISGEVGFLALKSPCVAGVKQPASHLQPLTSSV